MKKYEKMSLTGIFLIMAGVFMPWYGITEYHNINGNVINKIVGFVLGYDLVAGWAVLTLAVLLAILVLVQLQDKYRYRMYILRIFSLALISVIFITNVAIEVAIEASSKNPHVGLLSIAAGLVVSVVGIKEAHGQLSVK